MYFINDDVSQDMFVYQPILDTLTLKKIKVLIKILVVNQSEFILLTKLKSWYTTLLHSINLSGYRLGIKFDKDHLAVEQNNYAIKIVNIYIVCDLDVWPTNSTEDLKFKDCLFDTSNIVKKLHTYSVYGMSLNHEGSWNFANDFDENVMIFGVIISYRLILKTPGIIF